MARTSRKDIPVFGGVTRDARLSDKVTRQLSDAIEGGRIPKGERLPSERELGEQFQVSRTVIREAVRSLIATGHVAAKAGRGVVVSYDPAGARAQTMRLIFKDYGELEYSQVNEIRMPIEIQAAGLAALRASPEDIAELRRICDSQAAHIETGKLEGSAADDLAFHHHIARLADNPLLLGVYETLAEVLKAVRRPILHDIDVANAALREHRWLLECIAAGDPNAARGAMERHLLEAQQNWQKHRSGANRA